MFKKYFLHAISTAFTILFLSLRADAADFSEYSETWFDPNYSACEGLGVNGSGSLSVTARYERFSDFDKTTHFSLLANYPANPIVTAKVIYLDSSNNERMIQLIKPWYDIIHAPGIIKVLPQNATSAFGPGRGDSLHFSVKKNTNIKLEVTTVYYVAGGSCVSSFSETFKY